MRDYKLNFFISELFYIFMEIIVTETMILNVKVLGSYIQKT